MAEGTRDRMVEGAAQLLSRAGVSEASFGNVVALTGAPRGSIYHHFPGGKDELLGESVRYVGARLLAAVRASDVAEPADVVVLFAGLFRRLLVDSPAPAGCAVAAVASETAPTSPSAAAAADVFRAWIAELTALFERTGLAAADAGGTAAATVAAVEGALVLGRATGSVAVYDQVVEQLVTLARHQQPPTAEAAP